MIAETVEQAARPLGDLFLIRDIWSRLMAELSRVSRLLIHSWFPWTSDPVFNPTSFVVSPTTPPFDQAALTVANNELSAVPFASLKRPVPPRSVAPTCITSFIYSFLLSPSPDPVRISSFCEATSMGKARLINESALAYSFVGPQLTVIHKATV